MLTIEKWGINMLLHLLAFIVIITTFAMGATYVTLWLVERESRINEIKSKRLSREFRRKQRDFYNF